MLQYIYMNIRAIQTSYAVQWGIIVGAILGSVGTPSILRWILLGSVLLCLVYWITRKNLILYGMGFCCGLALMSLWTGYQLQEYTRIQDSMDTRIADQDVMIRSFPRTQSLGYQYRVQLKDSTQLYLTSNQPDLEWGDTLMISGRVSVPEEPGIQRYLIGQNVQGYIIDLGAEREGEVCGIWCSILRPIHGLRRTGLYLIGSLYPGNEGEFLKGILLGYADLIPSEIEESFRATGIRHILAISGYHVSLVVLLLYQGLRRLQWSRRRAVPITVGGIVFFILITGASTSTIRAGVLAIILLLAEWMGRYSAGMRPLVLTASLMLIFSPLLAVYSLGFQLSFLAVVGILVFSDALTTFSQGMAATKIRDMVGETVAAQLMVTPLLLMTFGEISLISVLGNVVIIPFIPLVMMGGAVSVLLYGLIPLDIIGYPIQLLISLILWITQWMGSWSFALLQVEDFPWWGSVLGYGVIGGLYAVMRWRRR